MRISVDQDRCQGHALCLAVAPELFDFDDEAGRSLPREVDVPPGSEVTAKRATQTCPEQAITIGE